MFGISVRLNNIPTMLTIQKGYIRDTTPRKLIDPGQQVAPEGYIVARSDCLFLSRISIEPILALTVKPGSDFSFLL